MYIEYEMGYTDRPFDWWIALNDPLDVLNVAATSCWMVPGTCDAEGCATDSIRQWLFEPAMW